MLFLASEARSFLKERQKASPNFVNEIRESVRKKGRQDLPPIIFIPGFLFGDYATSFLREVFTLKGARTFGWGGGLINKGRADVFLEMSLLIDSVYSELGPVVLSGWSFGGNIAEILASKNPEKIAGIITMGTPHCSNEIHILIRIIFRIISGKNFNEINCKINSLIPTLSLYSITDKIVRKQQGINIPGGHFGFLVSKKTIKLTEEFILSLKN